MENGAWIGPELVRLSREVSALGDGELTLKTRIGCWRMHTGTVRIPFYGMTGSGKSTAINALLGKIVLPENPNTSTPIEVDIGYNSNEAPVAVIASWVDEKIRAERKDALSFLREFCYNDSGLRSGEFDQVVGANVYVDSPLLRENLCLIDSLGIGASISDSRKTVKTLSHGSDIAVFLTSGNVPRGIEIEFIRDYLFGYGSIQIPYPIRPENLLILHNSRQGVEMLETGYKNALRAVFKRSESCPNPVTPPEQDERDRFLAENVLCANVLDIRLGLAGVFPYAACAPVGSSPGYAAECRAVVEMEMERLGAIRGRARGDCNYARWLAQRVSELRARYGPFGRTSGLQLIKLFEDVRDEAERQICAGRRAARDGGTTQTFLLWESCKKVLERLRREIRILESADLSRKVGT